MANLGLMPGNPRNFAFGPSVRCDLRLLEVDEALLTEILEAGVVIKGKEDDEAVLCTANKTYGMKLVETTNLQLLVQPTEASPCELRAALQEAGALEIGGRWRSVEPTYLAGLLELLLLTAQQEGMSLSELREDVLVRGLRADGYHPAIVRHCLHVYGRAAGAAAGAGAEEAAAGGAGPSSSRTWALDEARTCVHFAHKALGGRSLLLRDFTPAWGRAVPYGMTPSLAMLRCEALIDGGWVPGQSVEALLMRHARVSQPTPDGPLMYSAR
ncbi:putative sister chromatid cohesion protein DCC1 [Tetrabaena socialis]|uniref:Putative sister chromatid cohesion protein DCC1 n=1 Tax=Tetrabaena socialis TaxID=47790 RepID=A0A2J8A4C4_9CHLO|nr:putative sister chromatid cohesion protein DCC1 [Tetrabaena socialis]|eukprot:PNH07364.1 putative sister chromatid cohesion protein DCC1 [Tetrabaena socialis]